MPLIRKPYKKIIILTITLVITMAGYNQNFPAPLSVYFDFAYGNDSILLNWHSPESKSLSHYNIYFYTLGNGQRIKLGSTTDTTFMTPTPTFGYIINYGVSALYSNPNGESDTTWCSAYCPLLWLLPVVVTFEDPSVYGCGMVTTIWEGEDNINLIDSAYYSPEHSIQFLSDSINSRASISTTLFFVDYNETPKLSFMCKIPSAEMLTDTLKLFYYINSNNMIPLFEPIYGIEEWQLFEYSLESLPPSFHFVFEAKSGGGKGVLIDDIVFEDKSTGFQLNTDAKNSFNIFPNPATSFITIHIKEGIQIEEAIIYNHLGQKVLVAVPVNNTVDVSGLRPGIYFIEVATKEWRGRTKLVKQ